MKPLRVLLVEDDASIRRFVVLALEDEGIELVEAATLAQARAALADAPADLVICDLMLPDGSGTTLLQALAADPAARGGARLVAFSAGVTAERRGQLFALGVDEVLTKPVALQALQDCVRRGQATAPPAPSPGPSPVEAYFGGNQALFDAYFASCRQQFGVDLRAGDTACAAADLPALRRLAHSLKSVLTTLGYPDHGRLAAALEVAAAGGSVEDATPAWARLRAALAALGTGD